METRLALDTAHVTLEFDPHDEADRDRIAQLYRFGRILRHVATDDGVSDRGGAAAPVLDRFVMTSPVARIRRALAASCARDRTRASCMAACGSEAGAGAGRRAGVAAFSRLRFPGGPGRPATGRSRRSCTQLGLAVAAVRRPRAAERDFTAVLKQSPAFYPPEAGLGYAHWRARMTKAPSPHFDQALAANPTYAPALAGRGEALLALGHSDDQALPSFEAARRRGPGACPRCAAASTC